MIRQMTRGLAAPMARILTRVAEALRSAYSFDGVDDRGQLAFRAINPDGDIDIEWTQDHTGNAGVIVSQCASASIAAQEFRLTHLAGVNLELIVGGVWRKVTAPRTGQYRLLLVGNRLQLFRNGVQTYDDIFTRGAAREPAAVTSIGWRPDTDRYIGTIYNLRINGILYPIADHNQAIQLPSPKGLGPELINLTNIIWDSASSDTFVSGDSFGFTALDTWGQRSFRIPITIQANVPYLFDIEVTGGYSEGGMIRVTLNDKLGDGAPHVTPVTVGAGGNTPFDVSSAYYGSYRDFGRVTNGRVRGIIMVPNATNLNWFIGLRAQNNQNGRVVRLRNLTMRPLWAVTATELWVGRNMINANNATTTTVNSGVSWTVNRTGTSVPADGCRSTDFTNLIVGELYLFTIASTAPVVLALYDGSFNMIAQAQSNALIFRAVAVNKLYVSPVPQNQQVSLTSASVRKLDSLCNPLTLINTNPDRWQEVQP